MQAQLDSDWMIDLAKNFPPFGNQSSIGCSGYKITFKSTLCTSSSHKNKALKSSGFYKNLLINYTLCGFGVNNGLADEVNLEGYAEVIFSILTTDTYFLRGGFFTIKSILLYSSMIAIFLWLLYCFPQLSSVFMFKYIDKNNCDFGYICTPS